MGSTITVAQVAHDARGHLEERPFHTLGLDKADQQLSPKDTYTEEKNCKRKWGGVFGRAVDTFCKACMWRVHKLWMDPDQDAPVEPNRSALRSREKILGS